MWPFRRTPTTARGGPVDIGGRRFEQEIVGESYYQQALARIHSKSARADWIEFDAYLIPEPSNRHDKNAVMVCHAEFGVLGYLPRTTAQSVAGALQAWGKAGKIATCRGKLVGGNGFHYGVYLNADLAKVLDR